MLITHDKFKPKNIKYAFFTKKIPIEQHRYLHNHEEHQANNKIVADLFGAPSIAMVEQKHTNKVIFTKDYDSYCIADGQVTNKPDIALGVVTADCVPILLADDERKIIASVHSGWRGARASIMDEAVSKMRQLGAQKITAIIGPCIVQHNYEVDGDFYQDFIGESIEHKDYFIPSVKEKHYMFNLPGYVKNKLNKAGVDEIFDINCNTYEDEERFFSFRRTTHNPSSPMGNLISVIMINKI